MRLAELRAAARRIVVLCEGDSEELAVKHLLRRQFALENLAAVGLHPINLAAKLDDIFVKTRLFRADERVLAVFTLIDLFGLNRRCHLPDGDLDQKVGAVRAWLRAGVGHMDPGFFRPHISVHDIEAWLLAEGRSLARRLKHRTLRPCRHAESLNLIRPPKYRMKELFHRHLHRGYEEVRDGTALFRDLAHETVYASCRYYRELYDDLIGVARQTLSR